jgi:hypothetical protein
MTAEVNGPPSRSVDTFDICEDDDVVLVVGPAKEASLRVHSQCLRCSAKVVAKMLSPPWAESQHLSSDCPREIPLPEDDPEAMRQICYVIHHRNNEVSENWSPEQVLQVAILAEKYDMNVALKYSSAHWLASNNQELGDDAEMLDIGRLLASAYLFGNSDMFATLSLRLMLDFKGTRSYLELCRDSFISQLLPSVTFCKS